MDVDALIARGPEPDEAGARLARFREAGGDVPSDEDGVALIAALFGSGSFLSNIVLADVARFAALRADSHLRREKPASLFAAELRDACAGARTSAELARALRRARWREMLRLGARELGWGTTEEVARELSAFADACMDEAVRFADRELRAGYGEPRSAPGEPAPAFVVMGMGKLGGRELNFSSDVDLIYFYSTDEGAAGSLSLHEYYARIAQSVTRAISESTDDGFVFRVDLRLRPEGRSGAICNSLPAAERYYETFGRTWERQAWLRARPSAGDPALGEAMLKTLEPFVFPRSVGPNAIDEVRALRQLFREGAEADGFNVKLGKGGIRDVELVAQLLQLLYAGKRPDLRERTTPAALHKLWLAGLLSDQEERALAAAYRFFRRLEHRIQLEHGGQTHHLPGDAATLQRFALRLGFPDADAFVAQTERHRAAVSAVAETLGEPEGGPPALVLRLLDTVRAPDEIESDLRAAGFRAVEDSARSLELVRARLPPEWLREAIDSPDPDRALAHFRDLALRGSTGLFALLNEHPQLLTMLASLFGTSDRLSDHLVTHPRLWEPLLLGLGLPRPDPHSWQRALPERLAQIPAGDEEERMREMRRFQAEEILRIGLHDVAGTLAPHEVSEQLTRLAEACLTACVELVASGLAARYGRPDADLTILALGSLGARETRYGSDLDLVFLYSHGGTTSKGIDHQDWFVRLAQRLINSLGARLDEGRLYDVDTRLRPSGGQGLLVTSYDSFDAYHEDQAAPWERAALLRSRPVYSTGTASFAARLERTTYGHAVDETTLRSELLRIRGRIISERADDRPGALHVRLSAGGLTDLEFVAAYGQLLHGGAEPTVRTTNPHDALAALIDRGLVPVPTAVLEDYRFLQRVSLRLRLLRDQADDRLQPEDRAALARTLDRTQAAFDEELAARMSRVRQAFVATLGEPR